MTSSFFCNSLSINQLGNVSSPAVKILTSQLHHIKFKNQSVALKSLSLRELIQDEQNYVTYEGSLTIPSCEEVVTWIVINKVSEISVRKVLQTNCNFIFCFPPFNY